MKFTTLFSIALCSLFISCSTDSTIDSGTEESQSQINARVTDPQLGSLVSQFQAIYKSAAWQAQSVAVNSFAFNMNGIIVNFQGPAHFNSWISANLTATKFTSVSQGMASYNNMITKTQIVRQQYAAFFTLSANADHDQLLVIYQPFYPAPPVNQTNSACIENCIDADEACTASAYNATVDGQNSPNPVIAATSAYTFSVASAACDAGYMSCAGGCPVE